MEVAGCIIMVLLLKDGADIRFIIISESKEISMLSVEFEIN